MEWFEWFMEFVSVCNEWKAFYAYAKLQLISA